MSTTFLAAVNRMLRTNGFIRGDTDVLTSFSDTNHNSSSQLCQIAVQNELSELMGRSLIPSQHTITGTLTMVTNTRSYALPSDFIQLWGQNPFFYDESQNNHIFEYAGGEDQLRSDVYNYRTQYGYPQFWYWQLGATQSVSFFLVPDASVNGRAFTFDYSANVQVTNSTDLLPFTTDNQCFAFIEMAARRFKFLFEGKVDQPVDADPVYRDARSRLFSLINGKQPSSRYGSFYAGAQADAWRV